MKTPDERDAYFDNYLEEILGTLRSCAIPELSTDGKQCSIVFDDKRMKRTLKDFGITFAIMTNKEIKLFPPQKFADD